MGPLCMLEYPGGPEDWFGPSPEPRPLIPTGLGDWGGLKLQGVLLALGGRWQ